MPHLVYSLVDGYVHDWLTLGPCDRPVASEPEPGAFPRFHFAQAHEPPDFESPTELDRFTCQDGRLFWLAAHCQDDHFLEWSGFVPVYTHRQGWAFTQLVSTTAQQVTLHCTLTGPTTLWLNDVPILRAGEQLDPGEQTPQTHSVSANLQAGPNRLLARVEQMAVGNTALVLALQVDGADRSALSVQVPTVTKNVDTRLRLEQMFAFTHLDRAVYTPDTPVRLICGPRANAGRDVVLRLQRPTGAIYSESFGKLNADTTIQGAGGLQLPSGALQATLMPSLAEYYDNKLRAQRILPFWVVNKSRAASATYDERLIEAAQEAARAEGIFAEIAKMSLGWWSRVKPRAITAAIEQVRRRERGCLPELLGLLHMRCRLVDYQQFPADLLPALDACLLEFDYTERADDSLDLERADNQILLYTCRILAGQLHPQASFTASTARGAEERAQGERLATAWLAAHAQRGFGQWNAHVDGLVVALAHLVDLVEDTAHRELAAVLLDKLLFNLAVHSFQGTFGATRSHTQNSWLRSGRFAPESGLGRLLWGMGSYEDTPSACISLGLAGKSYQMPDLIRSIALDRPESMWARERHMDAAGEVNLVSYKTPDSMLSSAQDYRPGQRGRREQIWQATLGPEALVFTNHPTSFSQSDSRDAGWWVGNGVLPRVAQWHDTLIALYNLPQDDWLGFTHAYFPVFAFDEHAVAEGWAFARAGRAYLALWAARGMALMEEGPDAQRELRSAGLQNVWLCQLGREALDGSFTEFQQHVLARRPQVQDLQVEWKTARGDHLRFGWTGPLWINGEEQPITGFKHHESPYAVAEMPAETMDIGYGQEVMRLHFA